MSLTLPEGEVVSKTIDFVKQERVWIADGAVVIGGGTILVLMNSQSDRYPSSTMGIQSIGN